MTFNLCSPFGRKFAKFTWVALALISSPHLLVRNAQADIAVIINSANHFSLDSNQIKDLFLGNTPRFPNGSFEKTVDQAESSPLRKEFYSKLAQMDETAMKVYWSTLIFTGSALPPKTFNNGSEIFNFVKNNSGGIGYIDSNEPIDSSVKIIFVIR